MPTYTSRSPHDTTRIAKDFAKTLKGGEIVTLTGDLGAGKTAFTKGIATALNITVDITSPTFTLMNVYPVSHPHITELIHIDTYRMESATEALQIGIVDYLGQPNTVTIIEWPELIEKMLEKHHTIDITIKHLGGTVREIEITP